MLAIKTCKIYLQGGKMWAIFLKGGSKIITEVVYWAACKIFEVLFNISDSKVKFIKDIILFNEPISFFEQLRSNQGDESKKNNLRVNICFLFSSVQQRKLVHEKNYLLEKIWLYINTYLCPIHVVTFTLISNLATDYIQKRRGEPGQ